jgi:hypothetical protein
MTALRVTRSWQLVLLACAWACGDDTLDRSAILLTDGASSAIDRMDGGAGRPAMLDAGAAGAGRGSAGTGPSSAPTAGTMAAQPDSGLAGGTAGPMCLEVTAPCAREDECCGDLSCDTTTLGQVCCGEEQAPCTTANGEDCCRDLLCVAGRCEAPAPPLDNACGPPCTAAPALVLERDRLMEIGASFLGICGDANHTYGYHVAAANLPASDYSLEGEANRPVCQWHAAAIDIGMDWPASREWLAWLILQIQSGGLTGIGEVIGSYDGTDVRYWSDSSGWSTQGDPYTGTGHDTWTHVAIHRSTALQDHHILDGWTATGGP